MSYRFEGTVLSFAPPPWQLVIPFMSSAKGVFSYETGSAATHQLGECDCLGYRQRIPNGFFAKLGNAHLRMDDYVVEVLNDFPQKSGGVADIVAIRFATSYQPPLGSPIVADGIERSDGDFSISFVADSDYLSDASLPDGLEFADFDTPLGILFDGTQGSQPVLSFLDSLSPIARMPGDYDYDDSVDAGDYATWKETYGSAANHAADGNHDGVIDAADYTVWRNALSGDDGIGSLARGPSHVPEANATAMIIAGSLIGQWFLRFLGRRSLDSRHFE